MLQAVTAKELNRILISKIERTRIVLDIGCGIRPQNYVIPDVHICIEPFAEYANHLRSQLSSHNDRCYLVINCGWCDVFHFFGQGSVDSVFLIDIIEHIDKEAARELLEKTIRLARRQIVVVTPYGFMPQDHDNLNDIWGLQGGEWQKHRSGWDEGDFDNRWDLYVVPEYYKTDNQGRPLNKPNGILLAVFNSSQPLMKATGLRLKTIDLINRAYQRLLSGYRLIKLELRY